MLAFMIHASAFILSFQKKTATPLGMAVFLMILAEAVT